MSFNITIVYNPFAGRFRQAALDKLVAAFKKRSCRVSLATTEISEPIRIPANTDLICVMGGDGAMRLVVSAMLKQDICATLCVFPGGTINLAARELKYPKKPDKFASDMIAALERKKTSEMPILMSDAGPIICSFSAGPDAMAVHGVSKRLKAKIGRLAYAVSTLKLITKWPNFRDKFVITLPDNKLVEVEGGAVFLAKGLFYAGPFSLAPKASLINDRFHLLLFPKFGVGKFIQLIWKLATKGDPGKIVGSRQIEAKALKIEEKFNVPCQIDGDMTKQPCRNIWMTEQTIPVIR